MKVKAHPPTDTFILPAVFYSYFVVDTKYSSKDMEDMLSTCITNEYDREIVDDIFDENLENIDDV